MIDFVTQVLFPHYLLRWKNAMSSLKEFAVVFSQNVAWGDMDAVGHVNNVMYYRYIESARVDYLTRIDAIGQGLSAVIASSSCRFLRPVLYSTQQKQIVATGDAIAVMVNASTLGKAALPAELRQRIYALEQTVGNDLMSSESEERVGLTSGLTNAARSLRANLRENIKEGRETLKENIESIVPRLSKRD
jgi:acyl-CoA thioester hydrolase